MAVASADAALLPMPRVCERVKVTGGGGRGEDRMHGIGTRSGVGREVRNSSAVDYGRGEIKQIHLDQRHNDGRGHLHPNDFFFRLFK